jgi:hypothetical protein
MTEPSLTREQIEELRGDLLSIALPSLTPEGEAEYNALCDLAREAAEARADAASPQDGLAEELERCPCCGGRAVFDRVNGREDKNFGGEFINCVTCGLSTGLVFPLKDDVKRELRERWNRRALRSPQPAEPCCGEFATCGRPCTPRGAWNERNFINREAQQAKPVAYFYKWIGSGKQPWKDFVSIKEAAFDPEHWEETPLYAAPSEGAQRDAERSFNDWFVANYPGPNTVITDPHWHAPKVFAAAAAALSRRPA